MLQIYLYIKETILSLITQKILLTSSIRYIIYNTKKSSITTPSRKSLVQGKDRADLKELRFISSLSSFSRPFHDCPPVAKSLLSSFSTGPRYKNIVRGTSYVVGMNPGGSVWTCLSTLRVKVIQIFKNTYCELPPQILYYNH